MDMLRPPGGIGRHGVRRIAGPLHTFTAAQVPGDKIPVPQPVIHARDRDARALVGKCHSRPPLFVTLPPRVKMHILSNRTEFARKADSGVSPGAELTAALDRGSFGLVHDGEALRRTGAGA